jgi:hypothetical protein
VFIDDQGNINQIANPDMCASHMGKHVHLTAFPTEKEREKMLRITEMKNANSVLPEERTR